MDDELDLATFTKRQVKWNSLLENTTCTEIKSLKSEKVVFKKLNLKWNSIWGEWIWKKDSFIVSQEQEYL